MANDPSLEQQVLDLQLAALAVNAVCGYLLAKEAGRYPDPKSALMHDTAQLMGLADKLAAKAGGVSQPISQSMERICANAEATVTGTS
ncbi:hypothetical protein [Phyllobacterium endophyticum]|uniref:hypothetical protein n=1 Tax=Phyllobacterium endophyticum TaxID=1149773 RepID=UPI0011C88A01|nr:hypothetical protein [Phyllobacterium endophyticum]TXR50907.1 hypothetical protein FVA77_00070 [Phyllobacterium endophyticum]